jgi:type IV pilus biogenesis protein CpaD/CtpE
MVLTCRVVLGTALLALAACASSDPGDRAAQRAKIYAGAAIQRARRQPAKTLDQGPIAAGSRHAP